MIRKKDDFKCTHDLLDIWEWMENAFIRECYSKGIDPDDYGEITVSFSVNVKQKKG
jgi:hypothetical protein